MHKPAGLIPAGIVDMNTDMSVSQYTTRHTNNLMHTQAGSCTNVKQRHEDGDIVFDAPIQAATTPPILERAAPRPPPMRALARQSRPDAGAAISAQVPLSDSGKAAHTGRRGSPYLGRTVAAMVG